MFSLQMVLFNDKKKEEIEESQVPHGSDKKTIDSSSLVKLKLLLQGAPLGTERQGYDRVGMVRYFNTALLMVSIS